MQKLNAGDDEVDGDAAAAVATTAPTAGKLSKLESYFRAKEKGREPVLVAPAMHSKIEDLIWCSRLSVDQNVLEYWESKKLDHMDLYSLSQTVLSVPTTQVTMSHAFRALGLAITHRSLSAKDLNNKLILQLNSDITD